MAKKREKMSWQGILVIVVVAAMVLGLIGINIFTSSQYAAPSAPANTAQNTPIQSPITDVQVQTQSGGTVQVTPK